MDLKNCSRKFIDYIQPFLYAGYNQIIIVTCLRSQQLL